VHIRIGGRILALQHIVSIDLDATIGVKVNTVDCREHDFSGADANALRAFLTSKAAGGFCASLRGPGGLIDLASWKPDAPAAESKPAPAKAAEKAPDVFDKMPAGEVDERTFWQRTSDNIAKRHDAFWYAYPKQKDVMITDAMAAVRHVLKLAHEAGKSGFRPDDNTPKDVLIEAVERVYQSDREWAEGALLPFVRDAFDAARKKHAVPPWGARKPG
jgi:hypothetical protein